MFPRATDGQQPNNRMFSSCSRTSINAVLATNSGCFTSELYTHTHTRTSHTLIFFSQLTPSSPHMYPPHTPSQLTPSSPHTYPPHAPSSSSHSSYHPPHLTCTLLTTYPPHLTRTLLTSPHTLLRHIPSSPHTLLTPSLTRIRSMKSRHANSYAMHQGCKTSNL